MELLGRKNVDGADVRRAAELDIRLRLAGSEVDRLRAESKKVGQEVRTGDPEAVQRARAIKEELGTRETESRSLSAELRDLLLRIPNTPDPSALVGASED